MESFDVACTCVRVCAYGTSRWRRRACRLLRPGTTLTNDAWRRSATRRLIDATVTSRAPRVRCVYVAGRLFGARNGAGAVTALNVRVSACNPPCF